MQRQAETVESGDTSVQSVTLLMAICHHRLCAIIAFGFFQRKDASRETAEQQGAQDT